MKDIEVYFFTLQVFTPNKVYKGQKLIRLVKTKIADNANNTYAKVPSIIPCQ